MIYYLVAEKSKESICLVKETNQQGFLKKNGNKVISCSLRILQLLPRLQLNEDKTYLFSDN
jgi:hypothetical protein